MKTNFKKDSKRVSQKPRGPHPGSRSIFIENTFGLTEPKDFYLQTIACKKESNAVGIIYKAKDEKDSGIFYKSIALLANAEDAFVILAQNFIQKTTIFSDMSDTSGLKITNNFLVFCDDDKVSNYRFKIIEDRTTNKELTFTYLKPLKDGSLAPVLRKEELYDYSSDDKLFFTLKNGQVKTYLKDRVESASNFQDSIAMDDYRVKWVLYRFTPYRNGVKVTTTIQNVNFAPPGYEELWATDSKILAKVNKDLPSNPELALEEIKLKAHAETIKKSKAKPELSEEAKAKLIRPIEQATLSVGQVFTIDLGDGVEMTAEVQKLTKQKKTIESISRTLQK